MNRIIGIENESNKKQLLILAAAALFMGSGVTWFRIAAISSCISVHGSKTVALAMTLAMLLLPFLGILYTKLTANRSLSKTVNVTYSILIALMLLIGLFGIVGSIGVVAPIMVLFIKLLSMFTFVPFWQLVAKTFPGQKSCRSCMVITTGFPVSQIIAGATCTKMTMWFGTLFPIFAALIAIGITAVLIQTVIRQLADQPVSAKTRQADQPKVSLRNFKRQTLLVFGLTIFITIVSVLMTYVFQNVAESFVTSHEELTSILGVIEMAIGSLELFVMLFVSANLISRWGVAPGLLVLPIIISLLAIVMLSGAFGSITLLFFAAAIGHVTEAVTKPAFAKPSMKLLIDILPVGPRMRMVAQVETICKPLASAVAGGVILLFASVSVVGMNWIIGLLLICAIAWVFAGSSAQVLYRRHQKSLNVDVVESRSTILKPTSKTTQVWQTVKGRCQQLVQLVRDGFAGMWQKPTFDNYLSHAEPASVCGDSLVFTLPQNTAQNLDQNA